MVDKQEEIKVPERKVSTGELAEVLEKEVKIVPEGKEVSKGDRIISEELRREIELMDIDDNLKKQAEQKAGKISYLADDDKLKNLLKVAREKGVLYAIKVAKSMRDPFILDTLHDALAKEGLYKDFVK